MGKLNMLLFAKNNYKYVKKTENWTTLGPEKQTLQK